MDCCKFHNRLDLKLRTDQYVSSECGSIKSEVDPALGSIEGRPEYCCFDCEVLLARHDSRAQA